jgi:hypothetical protein
LIETPFCIPYAVAGVLGFTLALLGTYLLARVAGAGWYRSKDELTRKLIREACNGKG